MSYSVLTTLYDSTDNERIYREFTVHVSIYENRLLRVSRHPEFQRRMISHQLRPPLRSSLKPRPLDSSRLKSMKLKYEGWALAKRNTKNGDGGGTAVSRRKSRTWLTINLKDGQPHQYAPLLQQEDGPWFRSLDISRRIFHNRRQTHNNEKWLSEMSAKVSPWISRSITVSILRAKVRGCAANSAATR